MQHGTEPPGAELHERGLLTRSTTYLAKVAIVLQGAPDKMLTFPQLMDKLEPFFPEDRKSVENNIRVCLSTNKCFVKIPVVPDSPESKRNYWKLDCSQITAKMVRRHFRGLLQLFPELASTVEAENTSSPSEPRAAERSPEAAAGGADHGRRVVRFSGPFSIDSLLKRDGPSAQTCRASPLSSLQVGAEQPLQLAPSPPLQASAGRSPTCSTGGSAHRGLCGDDADVHINRMHVCAEPSFPIYARAAPYFCSPHGSCITFSAPAFTHDALLFRL